MKKRGKNRRFLLLIFLILILLLALNLVNASIISDIGDFFKKAFSSSDNKIKGEVGELRTEGVIDAANNLVAYFALDGNFNDISGNNNHGKCYNTFPLYRLVKSPEGRRLYTQDEQEKNNAISQYGYTLEGVTGYIYRVNDRPVDTYPLYRLHSTRTWHFLYTISEEEKNNAIAQYNFVLDGIVGYVHANAAPGTEPLYRLVNTTLGKRLYTTSLEERNNAIALYGFAGEGIAGYIFNDPLCPTLVSGKINQAYSFDGINDYIEIKDSETVSLKNAITISAWVKDSGTIGHEVIIAKDNEYMMKINQESEGGTVACFVYINNDWEPRVIGPRIPENIWTHLACTWDKQNGNLQIYINGVLSATQTGKTGNIIDTTNPLNIGRRGAYFKGAIDEVKIWNYVLADSEILSEYNRGGGCTPNCVNKQCGSDGCSGICGTCPTGQICNSQGRCTSSCTNECSASGAKRCNGANSETCGNYDADTCLEWGGSVNCPNGCNAASGVCNSCTPNCVNKQCGSDGCSGICGTCPTGQACNAQGRCDNTRLNIKNMNKYSNKEIFLISDKDWRDVLSLVPVTIWNGSEQDCKKGYETPSSVCVYPTLIYYDEEESEGFDADSFIYFIQQYNTNKVIIIGETPQELDNLLITQPDLGAGLQENQIQRISPEDYLSYWSSFKDIVYVKDEYRLALLASSYASLINAPLIIQGTELDVNQNFQDKNVICVGIVNPLISCTENYNLGQLQKKYVDKTNTKKIILTNPEDLEIVVTHTFQPERSSNIIHDTFGKASLASPILASAKHEIILPIQNNNVDEIDMLLENKAREWNIQKGFLTIMGTPDNIESLTNQNTYSDYREYSQLNEEEDFIHDLYFGRIFGISITDVSSYLNRAIFYKDLPQSSSAVTMAGDHTNSIANARAFNEIFNEIGYQSHEVINYNGCCPEPIVEDYQDKFIIFHEDHANAGFLGISSNDFPYFDNTFIIGGGCSTCLYRDWPRYRLVCANAIRKGSIGYYGMFEGGGLTNYQGFVSNVLSNRSLGKAFLENCAFNNVQAIKLGPSGFTICSHGLIGDPSLTLDPPYMFPLSQINKIAENKYEINLKVSKIFTEFTHIERTAYGNKQISISTNTPIFSSGTKDDNLILSYNLRYWNYGSGNEIIIGDFHQFMLGARIGPILQDVSYASIIEGFNGQIEVGREEWIDGQRYIWIYLRDRGDGRLPVSIPDTGSLFESVSIKFRLS